MFSQCSRFLVVMLIMTVFCFFLSVLEGQSKVFHIVIVRQPQNVKEPDAIWKQISVNSEAIGASSRDHYQR